MAPKARRSVPEPPRLLTPAELDALRREMEEAHAWACAELQRRQALREQQGAAAPTPPGSPVPSHPPAPAG